MARRRSRRRKSSYSGEPDPSGFPPQLVVEDLSPRARRLVEGGLIDLDVITGSGEDGRITSGDILHAARLLEMEQSVARIENVADPEPSVDQEPPVIELPSADSPVVEPLPDRTAEADVAEPETDAAEPEQSAPLTTEAATTTAAAVGGAPLEVPPDPWDAYGGVSEGLSESALPGAEQSWGEAEANIAAIAEEAAAQIYGRPAPTESQAPDEPVDPAGEPVTEPAGFAAEPMVLEEPATELDESASEQAEPAPEPELEHDAAASESAKAVDEAIEPAPEPVEASRDAGSAEVQTTDEPAVISPMPEATAPETSSEPETEQADGTSDLAEDVQPVDEEAPVQAPEPLAVVESLRDSEAAVDPDPDDAAVPPANDVVVEMRPERVDDPSPTQEPVQQAEAMMDFGTLEMVDPESVWAEGAEDFAPWFLAHSRQLGDVLGLEAGLSEARQFTTKSATGVVGRDDNDDDVVVVSSQNAVADDSDLGRALGMAASSGAATVALVSAKFNDEQLQALSWLNSQTKSGVQWYGIEMRVFRIADSPAAMLFDLVASPPSTSDAG